MKTGTFFAPEFAVGGGLDAVVFRYRSSVCLDGSNSPVFLALTKHAVNVYSHGGSDPGAEFGGPSSSRPKRILHLPLSMNLAAKDNLTSTLQALPKDQETFRKSRFDELGYSGLEVFSRPGKGEYERRRGQGVRLVLDFLWDLERSSVFEYAPCFEEVESRLRDNDYFRAIAAKAACCLARNDLLKFKNPNSGKAGNSHTKGNSSDVDMLVSLLCVAERQWLRELQCLCDRRLLPSRVSDSEGTPEWFKSAEEEWRDFYGEKRRLIWKGCSVAVNREGRRELHDHYQGAGEIGRDWFLRRFDIGNAWQAALHWGWGWPAIVTGSLGAFMSLFFWHGLSCGLATSGILAVSTVGLMWFLFIALISLLPQESGKASVWALLLPRVFAVVAGSWVLILSADELWELLLGLTSPFTLLWLLAILLGSMVAFLYVEVHRISRALRSVDVLKRVSLIAATLFAASLLVGSVVTNVFARTMLSRSEFLSQHFQSLVSEEIERGKRGSSSRSFESGREFVKCLVILGEGVVTSADVVYALNSLNSRRKLPDGVVDPQWRDSPGSYLQGWRKQLGLAWADFWQLRSPESTWSENVRLLANALYPSRPIGVAEVEEISWNLGGGEVDTLWGMVSKMGHRAFPAGGRVEVVHTGGHTLYVLPYVLLLAGSFAAFAGVFVLIVSQERSLVR